MSETVAVLREEIRDLVDIPGYVRGASGFRTAELKLVGDALDIDRMPTSSPMARARLRREVFDEVTDDGASFRKTELQELRDALQEGEGDE